MKFNASVITFRFFKDSSSTKPLPKTDFFHHLSCLDPVEAKIAALENSIKQEEEEEHDKQNMLKDHQLNTPHTKDNNKLPTLADTKTAIKKETQSRNSPHGSFGFGKLDSFRSLFDKFGANNLKCSPQSTKQFKPVIMSTSRVRENSCDSVGSQHKSVEKEILLSPSAGVHSVCVDQSPSDDGQCQTDMLDVTDSSPTFAVSTALTSKLSLSFSQTPHNNTSSANTQPPKYSTASAKSNSILAMFENVHKKPATKLDYPVQEKPNETVDKAVPDLPSLPDVLQVGGVLPTETAGDSSTLFVTSTVSTTPSSSALNTFSSTPKSTSG